MKQKSVPAGDEALKVYYDITDIIFDKRFEQSDKLLKTLLEIRTNAAASGKKRDDSEKMERVRLLGMEALWDHVERQYKLFTVDNKIVDNGHVDKQYAILITLVLYHLVRGNLCQRISQCYYENFELDASDSWAAKGIEIFWHGKNLIATLRDYVKSDERARFALRGGV